ncbi:class I SAM-dependent methyltransferase, partial [Patescibacteria group bacterium]|nr:class I SAM-dependent methyltransferase [Patescibacteria group bacterium]
MDVKYETILHCDFCGSSEAKLIDRKGHILQCRKCGLKFVTPRPTPKEISKIYDWNYRNCPGWGKIKPEAQLMHEKRFIFLEKFIQREKILDVGAGRGEFLSIAKRTGRWQCFGTETSQYAVEFAKDEFDIALSVGQLENLDYRENFFDAVCLWHVLEHLPYPSRAIKEAKRILKDNG